MYKEVTSPNVSVTYCTVFSNIQVFQRPKCWRQRTISNKTGFGVVLWMHISEGSRWGPVAKATFSKFAEAQSPCSGDAKH